MAAIDPDRNDCLSLQSLPNALVIDESELFRLSLKHILVGSLGFGLIVEAATIGDAIRQMETLPPLALLIADVKPFLATPLSAAPFLLQLRLQFPGIRLAAACLSDSRRDILLTLEAGVHGVLPKHLSADGWAQALRSIMAGAIYVPASLADLPSGTTLQEHSTAGPTNPTPTMSPALTPRQRECCNYWSKESRTRKSPAPCA